MVASSDWRPWLRKCVLSRLCCWQWWLVHVQPAAAGKRSVGTDAGMYSILVQFVGNVTPLADAHFWLIFVSTGCVDCLDCPYFNVYCLSCLFHVYHNLPRALHHAMHLMLQSGCACNQVSCLVGMACAAACPSRIGLAVW